VLALDNGRSASTCASLYRQGAAIITICADAMAAAGQVDADQLGRFLLTTLTFMGQPRMAEQASTVNNSARQAIDRARAAKRLDPQVSMKEVRLIIDLPGEVKDVVDAGEGRIPGPDGVPLNRMPWRRVRMFWRWRLGRLEVVRPHVRGRSKTACCGG
jgi:hypothetical protein